LLVPAGVVTITFVLPAGVPAGTLSVAVAEVELTTFALMTGNVPLLSLTVIGAANREPVSVTGKAAPTARKGGLMPVSVGKTLIEIVYGPVADDTSEEAAT